MTLFDSESNHPSLVAAWVADTVPLVMRTIRAEMRRHRSADLSVPQFRALAFLRRHPGASLSHVAEHVGLTLPSTSKMIDRLVVRGLVVREAASDDRRCITLILTPAGESIVQQASEATQACLAGILTTLPPAEQASVMQAMQILQRTFSIDKGNPG